METKICKNCDVIRPVTKFPTHKGCVGGRRSKCIYCISPHLWISSDKSSTHDYERVRNDPDYEHERNCRRHGITPEFWDSLLEDQGGGCAICQSLPSGRRLSIDHDHACCPETYSCGRCVRGLLCHHCNLSLGLLRDDVKRLKQMISYLEAQ